MTCIAWDGKTLAADKRCTQAGLARTVTKIHKVGLLLVGLAGDEETGLAMLEWVRNGRIPENFPSDVRDKDGDARCVLVVIEDGAVLVYQGSPWPAKYEDPFYATGSGRDYAIAAMHLGKTAREAVEIACLFDVSCGNGIDELIADTKQDIKATALHSHLQKFNTPDELQGVLWGVLAESQKFTDIEWTFLPATQRRSDPLRAAGYIGFTGANRSAAGPFCGAGVAAGVLQ